jgi:hypothetical protein
MQIQIKEVSLSGNQDFEENEKHKQANRWIGETGSSQKYKVEEKGTNW